MNRGSRMGALNLNREAHVLEHVVRTIIPHG